MVTMTDPDAPNGEGNLNNFVFTHWVYTQSNRDKTEKMKKMKNKYMFHIHHQHLQKVLIDTNLDYMI